VNAKWSNRGQRAKGNETSRETKSECAKKIAKKNEEIIQREPTSLPTGRSAYMYYKVKTSK